MAVSKSWCFTLNNYEEDAVDVIKGWDVQRLLAGAEVGENGTPHLQGYATFKKAMRLAGVRKLPLGNRMHWEITKSITASEKYCSKDGNVVIDVDHRKNSQSTLRCFVEDVQAGQQDLDLLHQYPGYFARYPTLPDRIRLLERDHKS